jgi:hypothetical protein
MKQLPHRARSDRAESATTTARDSRASLPQTVSAARSAGPATPRRQHGERETAQQVEADPGQLKAHDRCARSRRQAGHLGAVQLSIEAAQPIIVSPPTHDRRHAASTATHIAPAT